MQRIKRCLSVILLVLALVELILFGGLAILAGQSPLIVKAFFFVVMVLIGLFAWHFAAIELALLRGTR